MFSPFPGPTTTTLGRSFQRDSERDIHARGFERRERILLSPVSPFPAFLSVARARARDRAGRGVGGVVEVELALSRERALIPNLGRASTRRRRAGPVIPSSRELRGLGRAVGSRDPPSSFPPARIARGGGRARAPLRETANTHGRCAVCRDPRAAAAARNRVNASSGRPPRSFRTTPTRGGARQRDLSPPLSFLPRRGSVHPRFARIRVRGLASRTRALRRGRTSNDRSYARAPVYGARRKQSLFTKTTLSQAWSGNCIRGPQCAFEMSMFMCPAVHKLTRN